jgi:hypothetical protein
MTKKVNVTSGFLEAKDQFGTYLVTVPMFKERESTDYIAFAVLTYNGSLQKIQLKVNDYYNKN